MESRGAAEIHDVGLHEGLGETLLASELQDKCGQASSHLHSLHLLSGFCSFSTGGLHLCSLAFPEEKRGPASAVLRHLIIFRNLHVGSCTQAVSAWGEVCKWYVRAWVCALVLHARTFH